MRKIFVGLLFCFLVGIVFVKFSNTNSSATPSQKQESKEKTSPFLALNDAEPSHTSSPSGLKVKKSPPKTTPVQTLLTDGPKAQQENSFLPGNEEGEDLSAPPSLNFNNVAPLDLEESPVKNDQDIYRLLALFGDVLSRVRHDYVRKTNDTHLIDSALSGMLSSLDPHSSFMTPREYKKLKQETKGSFSGVGIEVVTIQNRLFIVAPIRGSVGEKAGLKSGDEIIAIDKKSIDSIGSALAIESIQGKPGTHVLLTVMRRDQKDPLNFDIERQKIRIPSVEVDIEHNDVGYIRISSFGEDTNRMLRAKFYTLLKNNHHLKGAILDLRNNPGGLLNQAIAVSNDFIEQGEIVSIKGRNPHDIERFYAQKGDILNGLPLVVLVNGGSASASEVVAGALQDQNRAVIMGTRSFGKGSVQSLIDLGRYGAIRLTTALYYTPSGRSIQARGIEPNIVVREDENQPKEEQKLYLVPGESALPDHIPGSNEHSASSSYINKEKSKDKQLQDAIQYIEKFPQDSEAIFGEKIQQKKKNFNGSMLSFLEDDHRTIP